MLDALKTLLENNVISEDVKENIEQAWEARVTENREQVSQQLREEFAQRYEHDKTVMLEAVDRMLTDQLSEEIAQFVEDRQQLAEQKAKLAVKAKANESLMKEFITRELANEVKELREDRNQLSSQLAMLEKFVVESLAQEIAEFHTDKQEVVEAKVRLVREGKQEIAKLKSQFVSRAAELVESTVNNTLTKEISQLKEDIEVARKNDFGRKMFEAFAAEYQTSYLNENSETARLLKVIDKKDLEVEKANRAVAESRKIVESKKAELKALNESIERQTVMHELLTPLANDKRAIMSELLESVQTPKLRSSFEKYLPSVIADKAPTRKPLVESKEVTGNKQTTNSVTSEDHNIFDIRRLAGLKY